MSQKKTEEKKSIVGNKIKEQKILQSELQSLRKGAKVYRKQQNSDLFFMSNMDTELKKSKKTMDELIKEYDSMDPSGSDVVADDTEEIPDDVSQQSKVQFS